MFARKVEELLEQRRLKGNTHTMTPYRDERKYEVKTVERQEGNKIKGEKGHWVKLEVRGGTCIPCSHVLAICATSGVDSNQHVMPFLRAVELMAMWEPEFYPLGDCDT